jgi:hypothetical protein
MPRWLVPWLPPLALIIALVVVAVSPAGVALGIAGISAVALIVARARYVKHHPPPELAKKPFWKF